jgi:hypothetical protein
MVSRQLVEKRAVTCPLVPHPPNNAAKANGAENARSGRIRGKERKEETMAPRTIYLGKLTGLYCLFIALIMMSHKQATVYTLNAMVHDAGLLFLTSMVAITAGLAIILAHNVWSGGALPVLVTLFGWVSLIKGVIFALLPPATSVAYFEALRYEQFFYLYMSITLVLGMYLTFASFRRSA